MVGKCRLLFQEHDKVFIDAADLATDEDSEVRASAVQAAEWQNYPEGLGAVFGHRILLSLDILESVL